MKSLLTTLLLITGIGISLPGVEEIPNTMSFQALLADADAKFVGKITWF